MNKLILVLSAFSVFAAGCDPVFDASAASLLESIPSCKETEQCVQDCTNQDACASFCAFSVKECYDGSVLSTEAICGVGTMVDSVCMDHCEDACFARCAAMLNRRCI